jgi:hypothetical protein
MPSKTAGTIAAVAKIITIVSTRTSRLLKTIGATIAEAAITIRTFAMLLPMTLPTEMPG